MNAIVPIQTHLPALVAAAGERARDTLPRILGRQYPQPAHTPGLLPCRREIFGWVRERQAVQAVHVATWIEASTRELAAPSVKQRLAALRHTV
jgi:hypothetical protein